MKFVTRTIKIEAMRWNGENTAQVCDWIARGAYPTPPKEGSIPYLMFPGYEGMQAASLGDWIVKGPDGEFFPEKPIEFHKKYEPEEESGATRVGEWKAGDVDRMSGAFDEAEIRDLYRWR